MSKAVLKCVGVAARAEGNPDALEATLTSQERDCTLLYLYWVKAYVYEADCFKSQKHR